MSHYTSKVQFFWSDPPQRTDAKKLSEQNVILNSKKVNFSTSCHQQSTLKYPRLLLSLLCWPKVILVSGGYCIT